MSYITVISLSDAKEYLRIDDTLTDDDTQITRMINSALSYVERQTNIYVYDRAKTYLMVDGFVRVYDYPINSITSPAEADMDNTQKTLYTNYCYGSETSDLVLDIGFNNPVNVPPDLIDVAYEIIDLLYYGNETGKTMKDLSPLSVDLLNSYKRFVF